VALAVTLAGADTTGVVGAVTAALTVMERLTVALPAELLAVTV
jgi:predicted amino acid-binding ACT domain protein